MTQSVTLTAMCDRRQVLSAAGVVALAGVFFGPGAAFATPEDAAKRVADVVGSAQVKEGRITIGLPAIADNGATVPVDLSVDSPMTESDYVKAVHIFAEGNPTPDLASFTLTPLMGKAELSVRVRLATSQNVVAVAEMSNGDIYLAKKEVKVTVGGCGG